VSERIKRERPSLEQRIADCLDGKAASCDVEMLLRQVETEIGHAEHAATQAHERSLDPLLAIDGKRALEDVQFAQLMVARWRNALPRLQGKLQQCLADEYHVRWYEKYRAAKHQRDAASTRFSELQTRFNDIIDIFLEAQAADQQVHEVNSSAPGNVADRLLTTELHSRNLEFFTRDKVSLIKETRLLAFDGQQIWPIKQPIDPAFFGVDGRRFAEDCGPDWWRAGAAVAELKQQQEQQQQEQALRDRDTFFGRGPPR
jgi:hypothetical protein